MRAARPGPELRTARLLLRRWRDSDLEPFAQLNADPEVMAFFPQLLRRERSDATVRNIELGFEERGYGLWAVEVPGEAAFIGFVGIQPLTIDVPFAGAIEIGWRLAREHWGHGYATEGAAAALDYGFDRRGFAEIIAIASAGNQRSLQVMERIGMTRDPSADFDHPVFPAGHPHARHVLCRLRAEDWRPRRVEQL